MKPSEEELLEPSNVMDSSANGVVGEKVKLATGGTWGAGRINTETNATRVSVPFVARISI